MKNILRAVVLFLTIFISLANAKFMEYRTNILSIQGNHATIKDSKDIKIGSSGVVIHNFSKNHSSVVARAIVISKNKNGTIVAFEKFDDLKQDVLPLPKILPTAGDKVILNYLYNQAMAITPNYQTYRKITSKYNKIKWLHPDLFGAKLYSDNNPSPTKKDFQNLCKDYNFYLLYFAFSNKGYFVDCNSFKVLKEENIDTGIKKEVPFYTRIKDISTSWLSFGKSKIANYDNYYKMLLR